VVEGSGKAIRGRDWPGQEWPDRSRQKRARSGGL